MVSEAETSLLLMIEAKEYVWQTEIGQLNNKTT
jgi:hypothetical protein